MADITFYTSTGVVPYFANVASADPYSGDSIAQILQQSITSYLATNSAQYHDISTGPYTYGYAQDGSFYIDSANYTMYVYGNVGASGSSGNEIDYVSKADGSVLAIGGSFNWAGYPELSAATSAFSINDIAKLSAASSGAYVLDNFSVSLQSTSSSTYAGTVTSWQEVVYNPNTGAGVGYEIDGSVPISFNVDTDAVSVGSGSITDLTVVDATVSASGAVQVTDYARTSGITDWNVFTPLNQLQFNTGSDTYDVTGPDGATVTGGSGNDTFNVHSAGNVVNGGGGVDTANFSNAAVDYIVKASSGSLTLIDTVSSTDTNNTLSGISQISFSDAATLQSDWFDGAIALAQSDPQGFSILTEVYLAYFNRAPDAVGLDFWAAVKGLGYSDDTIAAEFASSQESQQIFGTLGPGATPQQLAAFVNGVYENVLNRAPDAGGLDYWVNVLQNGQTDSAGFILQIIDAVNIEANTSVDKIYLGNKESVGAHFAITDGLTDGAQANAVMNTYNSVYASSGAAAAVAAANALADGYLANIASHPELVVQLLGVSV